MFYSQFILAKKGPLGTIWIAAHLERKLRKNQVADTDIGVSVDSILFPEVPIALRLSSHLLLGVVRIYSKKVNYLFDDCSEALLKIKQAFRSTAVDLPPEESKAPYHSITLPETFDLDDFELPDNEIFQGNYIDHHVSSREQITLQDTMDGIVYSTSQFGLDERFGDGDTSQVGLDLDEEILQDRVADDRDGRYFGADLHAADEKTTVPSKDATGEGDVGAPVMMLVDGGQNQVDGLAANTEFNEDAQAPQTPGLFEVPTSSSVCGELAGEDHMELDYHNCTELVEKCDDALNELGQQRQDRSAKDWCIESNLKRDPLPQAERGDVEGQNKSSKDLFVCTVDRINGECVESPCCSHVTTELEDPGRVQPISEVHNDTDGAEAANEVKSFNADASCPYESPARPTNPASLLEFGSASQMQGEECHENVVDKELQCEVQVECRQLEEQLDHVLATNNQLENVNGSASSDLPAPEKLLSMPQEISCKENDAVVESTPDKVVEVIDEGNGGGSMHISGKKRSFTESTLTMESFNSVESVGLSRFRRTAESIPDDDDLLSSILVGRSSYLKMKPSPVPEVASTKRIRSAPRATASKRKVLMDDPMVLHGDIIRQQLVNTEDIRRARKKAPCTRPEILMIHRQFLEDELLTEPIFTGMSVELVSLHSEPFDLRGLKIDANVEECHSAKTEDKQCPVQHASAGEKGIDGITEYSVPRNDVSGTLAQTFRQTGSQHAEGQDDLDQEKAISDGVETRWIPSESLGEKHEMEVASGENVAREICEIPAGDKLDCRPMDGASLVDANRKDADLIEVVECDDEKAGTSKTDLEAASACQMNEVKLTESTMDNGAQEENPAPGGDAEDSVAAQSTEAGFYYSLAFVDGDNAVVEIENEKLGDDYLGSEDTEVTRNGIYQEVHDQQNTSDAELDVGNDILKHGETSALEQTDAEHALDAEIRCQDSSAGGQTAGSDKLLAANDTEFLNVDNDEIPEDDDYDDDIQYAGDTRLAENSGWSSRTRAVAKYLQTLYDKETMHAPKILSMDNLLSGKTRKEASRMFFETLVLKTRDYVQVEQPNAFDDINIKPRPKLMKSEF